MSKWRCGSHHRELQQSTFPGDSWLAHPVLRRVVAPAQRGWVRDMNGMFFWHEWRSDNDIPTLLCWCSMITNPLPRVYRRHPLNTFKIVGIYKIVCVVSLLKLLWHKGPFWLVMKKAWRGSSPRMYFSHYHPVITSRKLYFRLIQHRQRSCCFTLFIHLETAKGWLLSDFCRYDVDVASNAAEQILWNIGTRDRKKGADLSALLSRWRDLEHQECPLKHQLSPERINEPI